MFYTTTSISKRNSLVVLAYIRYIRDVYALMLYIEDLDVIEVEYATESENRCARRVTACDCEGN
jgi:hypothetical protein